MRAREPVSYFRGEEVHGIKNEYKGTYVPANSVKIYENFLDRHINFDNAEGSWIDYRHHFSNPNTDVSNTIRFFREMDGRDVHFEPVHGKYPATTRKLKLSEEHYVLTKAEAKLYLEFSNVIKRIKAEYKESMRSPTATPIRSAAITPVRTSSSSTSAGNNVVDLIGGSTHMVNGSVRNSSFATSSSNAPPTSSGLLSTATPHAM
jgi:hypothetical protein